MHSVDGPPLDFCATGAYQLCVVNISVAHISAPSPVPGGYLMISRVCVRRSGKSKASFVCTLLLTFAIPGLTGNAWAQRPPPDPATIQWPSDRFPTLQDALDAVPEGGTLEIAEGEFRIAEPVIVTGKRLVIRGAGPGVEISRRSGPCMPRRRIGSSGSCSRLRGSGGIRLRR